MNNFGCTSCHGGRSRGTSFVSSSHTPNTPEELKKCEKLKVPSTVLELQEFRFCLKELNLERRGGKEIEIIKRSYKGSLELTKKLNMMSDNKSSKKLKDEL